MGTVYVFPVALKNPGKKYVPYFTYTVNCSFFCNPGNFSFVGTFIELFYIKAHFKQVTFSL